MDLAGIRKASPFPPHNPTMGLALAALLELDGSNMVADCGVAGKMVGYDQVHCKQVHCEPVGYDQVHCKQVHCEPVGYGLVSCWEDSKAAGCQMLGCEVVVGNISVLCTLARSSLASALA